MPEMNAAQAEPDTSTQRYIARIAESVNRLVRHLDTDFSRECALQELEMMIEKLCPLIERAYSSRTKNEENEKLEDRHQSHLFSHFDNRAMLQLRAASRVLMGNEYQISNETLFQLATENNVRPEEKHAVKLYEWMTLLSGVLVFSDKETEVKTSRTLRHAGRNIPYGVDVEIKPDIIDPRRFLEFVRLIMVPKKRNTLWTLAVRAYQIECEAGGVHPPTKDHLDNCWRKYVKPGWFTGGNLGGREAFFAGANLDGMGIGSLIEIAQAKKSQKRTIGYRL